MHNIESIHNEPTVRHKSLNTKKIFYNKNKIVLWNAFKCPHCSEYYDHKYISQVTKIRNNKKIFFVMSYKFIQK